MRIVVSIVSHGDQKVISESGLVEALGTLVTVVRENKFGIPRVTNSSTFFFENLNQCGFGRNHNKNFESAMLSPEDWFVICNPDIYITESHIRRLIDVAISRKKQAIAPHLWDDRRNTGDDNVRPFIRLVPLLLSFFGVRNSSRYPSESLASLEIVDWASGALFAIRADAFLQVGGFDERYFMYVEDVDLCRRLRSKGFEVAYCHDIVGIHRAARNNRKSFQAFRWHIRSLLRYFLCN